MDPVTAFLMQSAPGPPLAPQEMSDSEEDIMPARARAVEVDEDDDDAEDGRGGGGQDFESDESDSDAVAADDDDDDDDEDDDDDDDDDSEDESGVETDMDASDEDGEDDDSDDSDEDDDDDSESDEGDDSADKKKKKKHVSKKKTTKTVNLAASVPSLKFLKRSLKSVKLFMDVVNAHMRKTECTLYKAVDDVKKRKDADTEDIYASICLLNEKLGKFTQQVTDKLESDDRPEMAHAVHTLMTECAVMVDPRYAPSLFVGSSEKQCVVSGVETTMRLSVFKVRGFAP